MFLVGTSRTMFDMAGSTAIVTGSSRGMARATAEARVVQAARDGDLFAQSGRLRKSIE